MTNAPQTLDALWDPAEPCPFDEILDVRSPGEYAADRVPGAVNLPVLNDAERAEVGTLYAQEGAFKARRLGAGLVSANIGRHLAGHLADKGRDYRPLVYCWRGGQRSASFATVLAAIGWRVSVLRGGYKTYRGHVRHLLETLPPRYEYRLIGGATGSAKTGMLHRLAGRGLQVLDLEGSANHRGSVLGAVGPQPSQKLFESGLMAALAVLDPRRPVWVEAESNRIGNLYVPPALWGKMKAAGGVELRVPLAGRVAHLLGEYRHWVADPPRLLEALRPFAAWHGERQFTAWAALIAAGEWEAFVGSLLTVHYDRRYAASAGKSFPGMTGVAELGDAMQESLDRLADRLRADEERGPSSPS